MFVLGISGKKQAGKDTSASAIKDYLSNSKFNNDIECTILHWADTLKDFLVSTKIITQNQANGTDAEKNSLTKVKWEKFPLEVTDPFDKTNDIYLTARQVMQIYGTDIMRNMFCDSIWIDSLLYKIEEMSKKIKDKIPLFIIPDTRFKIELETIKDFNGYRLYITRPGFILKDTHSSENDICADDCDEEIKTSDKAKLEELVTKTFNDTILEKIFGSK